MRRLLAWLLIGMALVAVAVGAALTKLPVPAVISSAVAAVGAMVAGVCSTRAAAVMKNRDDRRDVRRALLRCDRRGRLPFVRELNDPVQLGVHPAAMVESLERVPAFVRRDVMARLNSAISSKSFVLLVGESTAGKSRLAYEAVRELLPDHRLVEPSGRDAVTAAVDATLDSPQAVLWLDDIERFLGEGGITGARISSILSMKRHSVVATMRSEEYSYFCSGSSRAIDATRSRETVRQGWEVLRLATRLDLPRSWSSDEVQRARRIEVRDHRIVEALEQVDRFGVAEYLAAGPQILAAWRDAWAPGMNPRGAALVLAAVDARRAGMHRPLSLEVLTRAHEAYLRRRGGYRLRPEPIDRAVEWATTPLHATSSLLIPSDDQAFLAFDYLIDAIDRETIPAEALEAFIDAGQPAELKDIGQVAWEWGRLDQADVAFERASASSVESRVDRGIMIGQRDGRAAREQFLRHSVEELATELGWDHEDTMEVRLSLAWSAGYGRNLQRSVRELRELRMEAERAIGAFHPTTLNIRRCIAMRMAGVGETREASRMFLQVFSDCIEHLDENEQITYSSMFGYVRYGGLGTIPKRAVELLDEFENWMRARRAPADNFMTLRYFRAHELRNAGQHEQALSELESIVTDEERMNGRHHDATLQAHCQWLQCMASSGDRKHALQLALDLLNEYRTIVDPQHTTAHNLRLIISTMTGEKGDVTEAVRILSELRGEKVQQVGEDDEAVRVIDYLLRYWAALKQARTGLLFDASDELRRLSEDITISHGVTWELREKVLHELGHILSSSHAGSS